MADCEEFYTKKLQVSEYLGVQSYTCWIELA